MILMILMKNRLKLRLMFLGNVFFEKIILEKAVSIKYIFEETILKMF